MHAGASKDKLARRDQFSWKLSASVRVVSLNRVHRNHNFEKHFFNLRVNSHGRQRDSKIAVTLRMVNKSHWQSTWAYSQLQFVA